MSDQAQSNNSQMKTLLTGLAILVSFGFVVLILTSNFGRESIEDRAYMGDFSEETIATRWANLEEVTSAQEALVDVSKVDAAMRELAENVLDAAKSDIVVPGSPTFMKQAEAASAPAEMVGEKVKTESVKEEAKPASEVKPAKESTTSKDNKAGAKVESQPKSMAGVRAEAKTEG